MAGLGSLVEVTSEISTVELIHVCRRADAGAIAEARHLLAGMDLVPLRAEVLDYAARAEPVGLRTVDAIHLASAITMAGAVTSFVVYDIRLAAGANAAGFEIVAPK